jgi:hypothetical protein
MDLKARRRAAVQRLIDDRFDGVVADFALKIERAPAQVWQFMKGDRHIGERLARDIELKLELSEGFLDTTQDSAPEVGLSPEEADAFKRLREASPAWRRYVLGLAKVPRAQQELLMSTMRQAAPQYTVENSLQEPDTQVLPRTKGAGPSDKTARQGISRSRKSDIQRK